MASSQILMADNLSVVMDVAHFLAANGLKRVTIVGHHQRNDPLIRNLNSVLSKSGKFYTRIVPLASDHDKVNHEDFYVFTPNSVLGNLSGVVDMVSETKVIVGLR